MIDKRRCAMCFEMRPIEEYKVVIRNQNKGGIVTQYRHYDCYCTNCRKLYNKEYKRIWREKVGHN